MIQNFFSKAKIPLNLPEDMNKVILKLKKSKNKRECLQNAYSILTRKYIGNRIKTYTCIFDLFYSNLYKIWSKSGFLHCNKINYLLRILLIKSGFFKESDIELKWTLLWYISPHQYLRIKIDDSHKINVDVWGKAYKIKFGDYAHGFH
jgi:hypothetical protein